jgi:hypothetical protein
MMFVLGQTTVRYAILVLHSSLHTLQTFGYPFVLQNCEKSVNGGQIGMHA